MQKLIAAAAAALVLSAGAGASEHHTDKAEIRTQLLRLSAGDHRPLDHRARNEYRHPAQTLLFFGIEPDMTVVEISPGGSGWYTEILAPFLRDHGRYVAASYDPESKSEYFQRNAKRYADKLAALPDVYDRVALSVFAPPDTLVAAPPGSADMVLTFRNTHNWMRQGHAGAAYKAFHAMLKPGGVLGVVQHRAPAGTEPDPEKGYLPEAVVIKLAEAAGFRLDGRSEVNANRADTADHPEGVWTLPPALRLDDADRDKYVMIGESDRMTLRFVRD